MITLFPHTIIIVFLIISCIIGGSPDISIHYGTYIFFIGIGYIVTFYGYKLYRLNIQNKKIYYFLYILIILVFYGIYISFLTLGLGSQELKYHQIGGSLYLKELFPGGSIDRETDVCVILQKRYLYSIDIVLSRTFIPTELYSGFSVFDHTVYLHRRYGGDIIVPIENHLY